MASLNLLPYCLPRSRGMPEKTVNVWSGTLGGAWSAVATTLPVRAAAPTVLRKSRRWMDAYIGRCSGNDSRQWLSIRAKNGLRKCRPGEGREVIGLPAPAPNIHDEQNAEPGIGRTFSVGNGCDGMYNYSRNDFLCHGRRHEPPKRGAHSQPIRSHEVEHARV